MSGRAFLRKVNDTRLEGSTFFNGEEGMWRIDLGGQDAS
jgi:hypothetical protein